MKHNHLICTGAALAAILLGSATAEAGGNRRHHDTPRGCGVPVVVAPPRGYCPPRIQPPVYFRPAIVSAGWGRPAGGCTTTVQREYIGWNRGYVETRRTVCPPVYPVYREPAYPVYHQPACGGGYRGYPPGYRVPSRGITIRF